MAKSTLREFINGYEQSSDKGGKLRGKKFFCRSFSGSVTPTMLRVSRRGIFKAFSTLSKRIQYISTKAVGAAFLSFGIVTIILSFLADYGSATGEATTISFIIGLLLSLIAIPQLLSDGKFFYVFQNVKVLDKILFDFLCINRVPKSDAFKSMPISVMAVFGAVLGFCGYFLPVWWVMAILLLAVLVVLAFGSPEFALFLSFFILPYISHISYGKWVLAVLVLVLFLSFVRKVMSGKRVFSFEQYDALLIFLMVLMGVSSAISGRENEISTAVLMIIFMLGYFITSNLITNRRLADCVLTAVTLSSVPPSIKAFYDIISAAISGSAGALISEGTPSTFADTESFALFLLVAITFTTALVKQSSGFARFILVFAWLLDAVALVLCCEPFAVLALMLGMMLHSVLNHRRAYSDVVTVLLSFVPYLAIFIIMLIDPAFLSVGEQLSLWKEALGAFVYNIVIGIGLSPESFAAVLGDASAAQAGTANIFIDIGLGVGIFALAAFVLMLLIRARHRAIYHEYIKHSEISIISPMIAVAAFSIIAFGSSADIFSAGSSYYLLWCVFGFGSALLRVAKKEYDDRALYFEDAIDSESSVADVKIL